MNDKEAALGLKALGDPVRLKIVRMLSQRDELCVCKIIPALKISQPRVSQHLRVLREARLVHARRQGKWMHYCLDSAKIEELGEQLKKMVERK